MSIMCILHILGFDYLSHVTYLLKPNMSGERQLGQLEDVYRAIQTLYGDNGIAASDKQNASTWLNDLQKSVLLLTQFVNV